MLFVGVVIIIILLSYLASKRPARTVVDPYVVSQALSQANQTWITFISNYMVTAKSKAERQVIARMLDDLVAQGYQVPTIPAPGTPAPTQQMAQPQVMPAATAPAGTVAQPMFDQLHEDQMAHRVAVDNASLLLYFGAFLFVASVGLFIGFAGATGSLRSMAVIITSLAFYLSGIWLFDTKPKLKQAGMTFVGIGMTIAPLAGLAAYTYLFNRTNAPLVWFVTSILCLGMYLHALRKLRRPLISYILIFTFLSLFESSVSIIHAPLYYFGWGLAAVGIILVLVSRLKNFMPELEEPSAVSSQVLMPLAILASAALVPQSGAGQLGVSLLLAGLYYALQAWSTAGEEQATDAIVTQVTLLGAVVSLTFAATHSWLAVAYVVTGLNVAQLLAVALGKVSRLWLNFASVLLVSLVITSFVAIGSPMVVLATLMLTVVSGLIIWWKQRREDGYAVAILAWLALPVVFGQYALDPRLSLSLQTSLLASSLLVEFAVYILRVMHKKSRPELAAAQQLYILSACGLVAFSLFVSPWTSVAVAAAVTATMLFLAQYERDADWGLVAGMLVAAPLLRTPGTPAALLTTLVMALGCNIYLALRYRQETNRWLSTIFWMVLPFGFGTGFMGWHWNSIGYAWAYFVVMGGLILSRAIARGQLMPSSKIPLASYAKTASLSYVVGYWTAGVLAVGFSLGAQGSQVVSTTLLGSMVLVIYLTGRYVEKHPDAMVLIPVFTTLTLWRALAPSRSGSTLDLYLFANTLVALCFYYLWPDSSEKRGVRARLLIRQGAMVVAGFTPIALLVVGHTAWPMPVGLLVLSQILYDYCNDGSQASKEWSLSLALMGVLWLMQFANIRNVQAYSHVIALWLAGYAYWRHVRKEVSQSDQYVMLTLAAATVPLVLQALSGANGGMYGLWLLFEEVGIMILGTMLRKRFVIWWGLYVSVGAVLYQLRNLGFAALAFLAIFVIGVAIYQLQKHNK